MLALLLCHGSTGSLGVVGREPVDPEDGTRLDGWRAACAEPMVIVDVDEFVGDGFLRWEFDRVDGAAELVVELLQRRSRDSKEDRKRGSSISAEGVVLRDELRECEVSLPRRLLGRRLRSLKELVAERE